MRRRDCGAYFSALAFAAAFTSAGSGLANASAAKSAPVLLIVGDSLSAEYGLARGHGWVALLEQRLREQKLPHQVMNASISGDTTAGGRARLGALLQQHKPAVVVIELGGNDALRGLPLSTTRENLTAMSQAAKKAGAKVVMVGMQVPPNYGVSYGREFASLFEQVAKAEKTALVPFLLKGVADRPDAMDWFQPDRIHPLAKAQPVMLDQVWPVLRPLLTR
ncbi:arylesterase [Roseateles sp.]|uniref:arylesterase n=1 Tax=Roseateles sp. TaxID=1971397 RepID=UPI003BA5E785